MNPGKHQSSKQKGQDLGWEVDDRAHLLFFTHTLSMNYVIAVFLLVSCMNTRNLQVLCTVNPQNSEQKPTKKKNFAGFHTRSLLLTMI